MLQFVNREITKSFIPKLCKNCKFFIPTHNECKKSGKIDLITGYITYEKASVCRRDMYNCGINGKWFVEND